jgi:hypothetical protein
MGDRNKVVERGVSAWPSGLEEAKKKPNSTKDLSA